jgi:hypothetical protein
MSGALDSPIKIILVDRNYLRFADAPRQPENRCPKRKLSIRHAQATDTIG